MKFDNIEKKFNLFIFNKYVLILIFIWFLLCVGGTYAFYSFEVEEESVIAGNVVAIDADLEVELVVGTNTKMVPMLDDALSNAIKGVGSNNGACIDSKGNLSCQIYKITLINKGSRLKHLNGSVELYAKEGNQNVYNNLKWRELTNLTTIKTNSIVNNMSKSFLVQDLTIESKETIVWYIAVWISETDSDQLLTDKGLFGGTVTFDTNLSFIKKFMEPNAISDKNVDFSKTSEESDTNGIYYVESTKSNINPIYYYRGNVNNNLIFADFCWKIVRTTETGGLKLIYNGIPSNGQCNNTGDASQIGQIAFNTDYLSPLHVGYMYGTSYRYNTRSMESNEVLGYGNDVNYSNNEIYVLNSVKDTIDGWESFYSNDLNYYHYTCFKPGTSCESVYYIYYASSTTAYYIVLTDGKKIEDVLSEMFDYNTISSTIKGNNTTEGSLDYWYYNNIERKGFGNYVEDTVWCNDRSISSLNGWNPNGGDPSKDLSFSVSDRVYTRSSPSLSCNRSIDKFTVYTANGNGSLDYPVGLLTADEIMMAGGNASKSNSSYYLYTGNIYWTNSPHSFHTFYSSNGYVNSSGNLTNNVVSNSRGVRPSISLKSGFNFNENGDGTVNNPYVVI